MVNKRIYKPSIRIKDHEEEDASALVKLINKLGASNVLAMLKEERKIGTTANAKEVIQTTNQNINFEVNTDWIETPEQLIAHYKIDLKVWELDFFQISRWPQKEEGNQLVAVKCKFKRRKEQPVENVIEKFEQALQSYKAPKYKAKKRPTQDFAGIINIYDAHIDKVTILAETGHDSDIHKNVEMFRKYFDELLATVQDCEQLIFPIGNDFFNVNDSTGTTKKGTKQATVVHHADAFEIGLHLLLECIDKAQQVAPVFVPVIQGNHDTDISTLCGVSLNALYRGNKNVEINKSRLERKYKRYHNNLFGFNHGDKVQPGKLPLIMAQEEKLNWSNTEFRYFFLGHKHHKEEFQFLRTKDAVGVQVRHLRAITQDCHWNVQAGWIGAVKSAQSLKISRCGSFFNETTLSF